MRTESITLTTSSESDTASFGEAVGRRITDGLCVSLVGPLGAGKSVLVRGVCRGLGVEEDVLSPTFILFEEYGGRRPVIHLDLYRLEHESEIEALGVFDRIGDGSVVLVEWGDRSDAILDRSDVVVTLGMTGPSERRIEIACTERERRWFEGVTP